MTSSFTFRLSYQNGRGKTLYTLSSFYLLFKLIHNSKNCKKVFWKALLPTICNGVLLYFSSLSVEGANIGNKSLKGGRIGFPWNNLSKDSLCLLCPSQNWILTHTRVVNYHLLCLSKKKSDVKNVLSTIHLSEIKVLNRCLCIQNHNSVNRKQKNKASYLGWNEKLQENLKSRNSWVIWLRTAESLP
jgi:hypothetical protein